MEYMEHDIVETQKKVGHKKRQNAFNISHEWSHNEVSLHNFTNSSFLSSSTPRVLNLQN